LCVAGDIGFDGIILPEARNELALYAGALHEASPAAVDVSQLSLSPSNSSGNGSVKNGNVEVPMDVDAVVVTKSPERSRMLLSTTVVEAGPADGDDVYDYGMSTSVTVDCLFYLCYSGSALVLNDEVT